MDARNLIELLEATTNPDPTNIAQAEERLSQVKKKNIAMCFGISVIYLWTMEWE